MKNDQRKRFADRLSQKDIEVPMQQQVEVIKSRPTEEQTRPRTKANETQLNVHIDSDLLKRLKIKGVSTDKNIKQMITEAIIMYLK